MSHTGFGFFSRLRSDARGTTSMEYALIATLISIVIIAGVKSTGLQINLKLLSTSTHIAGAPAPGPVPFP